MSDKKGDIIGGNIESNGGEFGYTGINNKGRINLDTKYAQAIKNGIPKAKVQELANNNREKYLRIVNKTGDLNPMISDRKELIISINREKIKLIKENYSDIDEMDKIIENILKLDKKTQEKIFNIFEIILLKPKVSIEDFKNYLLLYNFEKDKEFVDFLKENEKYIISEDKTKLSEDKTKLSEDKTNLSEDKTKLSEDKTKLSEDKTKLSEDKTKLSEDKTKLSEDKTKLSEEQKKELGKIKDNISKNPQLKDIYEKYKSDLETKNPKEYAESLLADLLKKIKENRGKPGYEDLKKDVFEIALSFQKMGVIKEDKVTTFITEIQKQDIDFSNKIYRASNVGKETGLEKGILDQNYKQIDSHTNIFEKKDGNIKDQVIVYKDGEVKRKFISESGYGIEVPITLTKNEKQIELEEKLRIVDLNITKNKQKQEKVNNYITNLSLELDKKKQELSVNLDSQNLKSEIKKIEEDLNKIKILKLTLEDESKKLAEEKEFIVENKNKNSQEIDANIKNKEVIAKNKIEVLDNLKLTSIFSQNHLDKILYQIQTNEVKSKFTGELSGIIIDFNSEYKKQTETNLKKIISKLLKLNENEVFNPGTNEYKFGCSPEKIRTNFSEVDPKILESGVLNINGLKSRLESKRV